MSSFHEQVVRLSHENLVKLSKNFVQEVQDRNKDDEIITGIEYNGKKLNHQKYFTFKQNVV